MNGLGSAEQFDYFFNLQPDIAVLPELKQKNIEALRPNCASWVTNSHANKAPKGLGILTFGETCLKELPFDKDMEIYLPVRVTNSLMNFNLIGVWNFYYACKQGRFKDVRGDGALEWAAIEHYTTKLNGPCIFGVIGILDLHLLSHHFYICVICSKLLGLKVSITVFLTYFMSFQNILRLGIPEVTSTI